jgi:hypothetical protein
MPILNTNKAAHAYEQVRNLIILAFRGASFANTILLLSLPLMYFWPDIIAVGYLTFYYLIWIVLPAASVLLIIVLIRKQQGLPIRTYLANEFKYGRRALAWYFMTMLVLLIVSQLR